jgi:hypothetical protein
LGQKSRGRKPLSPSDAPKSGSVKREAQSTKQRAVLDGTWKWKPDPSPMGGATQAGGTLILRDMGDKVFGGSLINQFVKASPSRISVVTKTALLEGVKEVAEDGSIIFIFTVEVNNQRSTSKAILDPKTNILTALTFAANDKNTVMYRWSAVRTEAGHAS